MKDTPLIVAPSDSGGALWRPGLPVVLPYAGLHDLQRTSDGAHIFGRLSTECHHVQAYLILAVVLGAALGHFVFGSHFDINAALSGPTDSKGMSCH